MEGKDYSTQEIESIIAQIQGVISGRLVCHDGEIVEVHVLADKTRSPKQVVRDIESAVLIKLGLEIDHKRISVAQLESGITASAYEESRFQFKGITYSAENNHIAIMITIKAGADLYTAKITGPNTKNNRLRLTASATLSAIEQSLNIEGRFIIGDIQKIDLCDQEILVTAIYFRSNHQEEILLGTAINKGDDLESTVRASLDAINRRLTLLKNS